MESMVYEYSRCFNQLDAFTKHWPWPWQEVKKRQLSTFKIIHVSLIMLVFCISHVFVFLIVVRYRKDTKTPCREEVEGMIVTSPFSVRRGVYTKSVRFQRVCVNYMIVMT